MVTISIIVKDVPAKMMPLAPFACSLCQQFSIFSLHASFLRSKYLNILSILLLYPSIGCTVLLSNTNSAVFIFHSVWSIFCRSDSGCMLL